MRDKLSHSTSLPPVVAQSLRSFALKVWEKPTLTFYKTQPKNNQQGNMGGILQLKDYPFCYFDKNWQSDKERAKARSGQALTTQIRQG